MLRGQRTRRTTHHRRPCSFLIDSAAFNIVTMSVSARAVDVLANRQVIQIGDGGGGGSVEHQRYKSGLELLLPMLGKTSQHSLRSRKLRLDSTFLPQCTLL